jgi:hypothetical protein
MEEIKVCKCPVCKEGDILEKDKLFVCSNSNTEYNQETKVWEEKGTCSYKIFKSSLSKLGKPTIVAEEVKELCENGTIKLNLISKAQKPYEVPGLVDPERGIKADFESFNK